MKSILIKLGKLMSVRMLAIVLTFVQTIVMTRVFGSEVFGLLSFGLSISALLILVLSFGLDQVLMRDIARFGAGVAPKTERWSHVWQLIRRYVIPLTLIVSVAGSLVAGLTHWTGVYSLPLIGSFILLPIMLTRKYVEAISLGTKQVLRSIIGSQIAYPILMIVGGISVLALGLGSSAMTVTATYIFAGVGSLIVSIILTRTTLLSLRGDSHGPRDSAGDSPGQRALLTSGGHFALVSLGFVLGQHVGVLMTGFFSTPEDVAIVRIAGRVAEMAGLMRAIVVLQYRPIIAEAFGKADRKVLERHCSFMLKFFVATGLPITVSVLFFAEPILSVFGPEFSTGGNALRIYVVGVFLTLICGPGDVLLSQTNKEGSTSRILMVALLVQITFGVVLIPVLGVIGCALANAISLAVQAFLLRRKSISHFGIDPSVLSWIQIVVPKMPK